MGSCPKCGGNQGYEQPVYESHMSTGEWGSDPYIDNGESLGIRWGMAKCLDYRAGFRKETIDRLRRQAEALPEPD